MASNILDLEELVGKDVFTNKGAYCGKIKDIELDLPRFRVRAVVVDAAKGSYMASKVGGKKGVIVPYSMVTSIADVVMIKHFSSMDSEDDHPREKVEA